MAHQAAAIAVSRNICRDEVIVLTRDPIATLSHAQVRCGIVLEVAEGTEATDLNTENEATKANERHSSSHATRGGEGARGVPSHGRPEAGLDECFHAREILVRLR
jgi:hypothetical protein